MSELHAIRLGAVATARGGTGFPESAQGGRTGIPFIKVSDMSLTGNEKFIRRAENYISPATARALGATVFPAGAVVFAKVGAALYLNKRRILAQPTVIDNNMMAVAPTCVDSEFLYYALCNVDLGIIAQPGAVPSVNQAQVHEITLPDLARDRQGRVVDLLSALDEQTEAVALRISKERLRFLALQDELLSCQAAGALEAEDVGLDELIPRVQYGISSGLDFAGAVPVLRMNNLSGGEIDVTDLKFTSYPVANELLLRDGDVLFNRTNSIEHVGRVSLWRGQLGKATFASYLVRLFPREDRITNAYLVYLLGWAPNQIQMRRYSTPGVQQVNINPTSLRRCRVRIPKSLSMQRDTVEVLDAVREYINSLEVELSKLQAQKLGIVQDLFAIHRPACRAGCAGALA
jgi:type I restriction enzyme S subunit